MLELTQEERSRGEHTNRIWAKHSRRKNDNTSRRKLLKVTGDEYQSHKSQGLYINHSQMSKKPWLHWKKHNVAQLEETGKKQDESTT